MNREILTNFPIFLNFIVIICVLSSYIPIFESKLTINRYIMKKNLLAAIVVFFFTFVVLLVMNDMSSKNSQHVEKQYSTVEE